MPKIIAFLGAGFEVGAMRMPVFGHAQRVRARHNRVAPLYGGRPSWRTRLRRTSRRIWPGLPKSDEEVLLAMRLALEFGHVDWLREPIGGLRLLKPLPDSMLAADGKTSFRYFKVQKAACTSVVRMLLQSCGRSEEFAGAGAAYRRVYRQRYQCEPPGARGSDGAYRRAYRKRYVHNDNQDLVVILEGAGWRVESCFYRYKPFVADPRADIRFCVVRDPVERFQAAFDDIVQRRNFYSHGITVEQFLRRIEEGWEEAAQDRRDYGVGRFARDMHFRPQHFSLGEDASYFTHIFNLRQLTQLRDLLSELAGEEIPLVHANARAPHAKIDLTAAQKKRVAELYAEDYRVFGRWF